MSDTIHIDRENSDGSNRQQNSADTNRQDNADANEDCCAKADRGASLSGSCLHSAAMYLGAANVLR